MILLANIGRKVGGPVALPDGLAIVQARRPKWSDRFESAMAGAHSVPPMSINIRPAVAADLPGVFELAKDFAV